MKRTASTLGNDIDVGVRLLLVFIQNLKKNSSRSPGGRNRHSSKVYSTFTPRNCSEKNSAIWDSIITNSSLWPIIMYMKSACSFTPAFPLFARLKEIRYDPLPAVEKEKGRTHSLPRNSFHQRYQ